MLIKPNIFIEDCGLVVCDAIVFHVATTVSDKCIISILRLEIFHYLSNVPSSSDIRTSHINTSAFKTGVMHLSQPVVTMASKLEEHSRHHYSENVISMTDRLSGKNYG